MKIAIIDDQKQDQDWAIEKIQNYMNKHKFTYRLYSFQNGEQFLSALETQRFDIVFMDIYMDGMNGLETATHLRNLDKECKLIFFSSTQEFLRQGYSFNLCHYLVKPVDDAAFEQAMENCCLKKPEDVIFLDVLSDNISLHIDTRKIQFIDFSIRNTIIHTNDGNYIVSEGFTKVTKPLIEDKRFLLCFKGVLVNMDFIKKTEDSMFLLKSGVRIPIALRNQKNVIRQYNDYLFEQMNRRFKRQ